MLDSYGLVAAYVVLVVLLLLMLLYLRWHWLAKLVMVGFASLFFYVSYLSIPDYFGWPTANYRPEKLRLVAIYIDAPRKIYLWGHDLSEGLGEARPRAYELQYTERLNNALNKAANKLKKGFPMIGEFRRAPAVEPLGEGFLTDEDDLDMVIYDVPEALAPGGKKE